jgi:hypothetical protein
MFDTTKEDLRDILKYIDQGKLQLPDFQRDYVWGDDDVKSLLASIAKGFSIVNKTPLSKYSNILISGDAPSVYLKRIEEKHGITAETLDNLLRTHLIEPKYLRSDDFQAFFNARLDALAALVSKAMDKPVVKEHGSNETEMDDETNDEDSNEQLKVLL